MTDWADLSIQICYCTECSVGRLFVNLAHNSGIVRWTCRVPRANQDVRSVSATSALVGTIGVRERFSALFNFLKTTPLGDAYSLGAAHGVGRLSSLRKLGGVSIPGAVLLFSLYRYAEERGSYDFTVAQLVSDEANGGPAKEFGLSRENLVSALREMSTTTAARYVHIDLLGGLDNISLERSLSAVSALQRFWSEWMC